MGRVEKAAALLDDAQTYGAQMPVEQQQILVLAAQVQATLAVVDVLERIAAAIDTEAAR